MLIPPFFTSRATFWPPAGGTKDRMTNYCREAQSRNSNGLETLRFGFDGFCALFDSFCALVVCSMNCLAASVAALE